MKSIWGTAHTFEQMNVIICKSTKIIQYDAIGQINSLILQHCSCRKS